MAMCDSGQKSRALSSRRWLVEALSAFDDWQRQRQAVFEYSQNPACIFRLEVDLGGDCHPGLLVQLHSGGKRGYGQHNRTKSSAKRMEVRALSF